MRAKFIPTTDKKVIEDSFMQCPDCPHHADCKTTEQEGTIKGKKCYQFCDSIRCGNCGFKTQHIWHEFWAQS